MAVQQSGSHGQNAQKPSEIPLRGWKVILRRVWHETSEDRLSLVAAGVAFYCLLAIFPAIAAFVMLYGTVSDPNEVMNQLARFQGVVPQAALDILTGQLTSVAQSRGSLLGWGAVLSLLFALWSSTKGVKSLMTAMNIVYEEGEDRGFLVLNLLALALTLGAILFVPLALLLITVLPLAVAGALPDWLATLLLWGRWLLLLLLVLLAIGALYRWGPSRSSPRVAWITPGAIAAAILWLLASLAFSFYVQNFGSYNETFGSLGAVVILLMWFYISAFVVCLGAELNSELERQTARDTTVGPERPAGRRGAAIADETARST